MTHGLSRLILLGGLLAASAGCTSSQPRPAPPPPVAARSPAPVASPTPTLGPVTVGEVTYNNYGLRDLHGKTRQGIDAGDFYFKGTFLQGAAGQKVTLRLKNTGTVPHNFSVPALEIDRALPLDDQRVDIEVTLPTSGAVRFFCKLHTTQGMNGQLLVESDTPQPVALLPGLPAVPVPGDDGG